VACQLAGESKLAALSAAHLEELSRLRTRFDTLSTDLPDAGAVAAPEPGVLFRRARPSEWR